MKGGHLRERYRGRCNEKIISMYALVITVRDIQADLQVIYRIKLTFREGKSGRRKLTRKCAKNRYSSIYP